MIFAKSTFAKLSLFNFVAKKEVFFYKTNSPKIRGEQKIIMTFSSNSNISCKCEMKIFSFKAATLKH